MLSGASISATAREYTYNLRPEQSKGPIESYQIERLRRHSRALIKQTGLAMKSWCLLMRLPRIFTILLVILLLNTAYVAAFAEPTIFYLGNVLAHLVIGCVLAALAVKVLPKPLWIGLGVSALLGIYLAAAGNTFNHSAVLWVHIVVSAAVAILAVRWVTRHIQTMRAMLVASLALLIIL